MSERQGAQPPRAGRWTALLLRFALAALVLVAAVSAVTAVRIATAPAERAAGAVRSPAEGPSPAGSAAAGPPLDVRAPAPQAARSGAEQLRGWADALAARTGVPARALMAYGHAELTVRGEQPGCRLSWATLAAIGRVESDHGRYQDRVLGEDGRSSAPIVGVPLDGSPGVRDIPDTDDGALDGDPVRDRAVGPMQFIPATWARWGADGDGDGTADPQQIDDAALAAARYLCADGRDLRSAGGWWRAVLAYNNSAEYGRQVFDHAERYARASA